MAKVTSDIHHVAHTYAFCNPIVVSVLSDTGRAYTMLRQTESCYSDSRGKEGAMTRFGVVLGS